MTWLFSNFCSTIRQTCNKADYWEMLTTKCNPETQKHPQPKHTYSRFTSLIMRLIINKGSHFNKGFICVLLKKSYKIASQVKLLFFFNTCYFQGYNYMVFSFLSLPPNLSIYSPCALSSLWSLFSSRSMMCRKYNAYSCTL